MFVNRLGLLNMCEFSEHLEIFLVQEYRSKKKSGTRKLYQANYYNVQKNECMSRIFLGEKKSWLALTTVDTALDCGGRGGAVVGAADVMVAVEVGGGSIGTPSSSSGSGWASRAIVDCLLLVVIATLFKSSSAPSSSVNFLLSVPLLPLRQNRSFISAKYGQRCIPGSNKKYKNCTSQGKIYWSRM